MLPPRESASEFLSVRELIVLFRSVLDARGINHEYIVDLLTHFNEQAARVRAYVLADGTWTDEKGLQMLDLFAQYSRQRAAEDLNAMDGVRADLAAAGVGIEEVNLTDDAQLAALRARFGAALMPGDLADFYDARFTDGAQDPVLLSHLRELQTIARDLHMDEEEVVSFIERDERRSHSLSHGVRSVIDSISR